MREPAPAHAGGLSRLGRATVPLAAWLVVVASAGTFRVRSVDALWQAGGLDAAARLQVACWLALGALAAALVATGRANLRLLRRGPLFWYALFAAAAVLSALYSPVSAFTLFCAAQLMVAVVLVASARQDTTSLYLCAFAYVAVNWAAFLLGFRYPAAPGESWRFGSVLGLPTDVGFVAAVAAAGLFARLQVKGRSRRESVMLCVLLLTALLARSRTAVLALAAALVLALALAGRFRWLTAAAVVGVLLLSFQPTRAAAWAYFSRGQSLDAMAAMTGRIGRTGETGTAETGTGETGTGEFGIYGEAVARIRASPWLGEGYMVTRRFPLSTQQATHAHNVYLDAMLSIGLAGAVLATCILASWGRGLMELLAAARARGARNCPAALELTAMALPVLAFCATEWGFVARAGPSLMVALGVLSLTQSTRAKLTECGVHQPSVQ